MEAARHFPHVQRLHFDPEQILGFTQMPGPIWTDPSVSDLDVRVHGFHAYRSRHERDRQSTNRSAAADDTRSSPCYSGPRAMIPSSPSSRSGRCRTVVNSSWRRAGTATITSSAGKSRRSCGMKSDTERTTRGGAGPMAGRKPKKGEPISASRPSAPPRAILAYVVAALKVQIWLGPGDGQRDQSFGRTAHRPAAPPRGRRARLHELVANRTLRSFERDVPMCFGSAFVRRTRYYEVVATDRRRGVGD